MNYRVTIDLVAISAVLRCSGVGRDKDCLSALQFYFNRRVTDDEMRFLHECMKRAAACMPEDINRD